MDSSKVEELIYEIEEFQWDNCVFWATDKWTARYVCEW